MAGAFSRKASGISCDLTAFRKIKELRANAVETPLGVTGLLLASIVGTWPGYFNILTALLLSTAVMSGDCDFKMCTYVL